MDTKLFALLIDDNPYFFVYNDSDGDVSKWPFDQQHYLILNLAIGGDWGGVQGVIQVPPNEDVCRLR